MKAHTDNPIAPPSVSLRSRLGDFLVAAAIFLLLISARSNALAGSDTWKQFPSTGDWNTAVNWTSDIVPNGSADTATFARSNITSISLSATTQVNGIVFTSGGILGASVFTITATPSFSLVISGTGIVNNSALTQNFVIAADSSGSSGLIFFSNSATAGSLTVFTNNGQTVTGAFGPSVQFHGTSTAGNGTFNNNGGTVNGAGGGGTIFFLTSSASNATLIANGGVSGGFSGGYIQFSDDSTGGTARVEVFGNGNLDISGHNLPGVSVGSIEGNGLVFLGANNLNLTVGSNNLSTTFSGLIQDGGVNTGGTGGSLTKAGTGTLSLTTANIYSGATTVNGGTLLVMNQTGCGSATGTGPVQVNDAGTLGGTGKIAGRVSVGTGSSSGAILLAGNSATSPGTLTINNTLTFNSLSTYKCVLNRSTVKASKATALGVTINSGAPFTFVDTGTGTLATGTVFTVINNTSANPIFGRFSNLAQGAVFTSNGNNFKASYTGGTGNDLTLTVVP